MKRLLTLLLAALVIAATGCIFGDDDDGDDSANGGNGGNGGAYQAEDYIPLVVGSSLTFRTTDYYFDETGSYTMTITGTTEQDGYEYYILLDEYDDYTEPTYAAIRDNIFWIYEEPWDQVTKGAIERSSMPAAAKAALIDKVESPEDHRPLIDFNQDSWDIYSETDSYEGYTYSVSMTGSFEGVEDVETPAGTFSDCLKFLMVISYTGSEGTETYSDLTHQYIYFAKDIGPVKVLEQSSYDNGPLENVWLEELTAYSTGE